MPPARRTAGTSIRSSCEKPPPAIWPAADCVSKKRHGRFFEKGDRAGCGLLGEGAVEERSDLPAGAVRGEGGAEAPPLNVWGISSLE